MGRLEKLLAKMRRFPPEMRYEEVAKVLEAFGFVEHRSSGSHHVFYREGCPPLTVPRHRGRVVKATYLKLVLELLEDCGLVAPEG